MSERSLFSFFSNVYAGIMETTLSLTTDGVEMVDYPLETKLNVQLTAVAWRAFLELPNNIKDEFTADQLQSGVGYERKGDGGRESNDIKENFDITRESIAQLTEKAQPNEVVTAFLLAADKLFDSLKSMVIEFGKHVEETYNIPGFAAEALASSDSLFVRYLKYPPVPVGTVIGEAHVDHSGFTFHLYESTGGCERLTYDNKRWVPMPVAPDKAAVFPSMQTQLFSQNKLHGLCHHIIANDTTSQSGREAIVAFVPLVNMPAYDRKTHGRLQEMEPGFNYDMPYEVFQKYFVSRP